MLSILSERERSHCICRCTCMVDESCALYTPWNVKYGKTQYIRVIDVDVRTSRPYIYIIIAETIDMEHRLSGVDTSLGGVEQVLFELEVYSDKLCWIKLSISRL